MTIITRTTTATTMLTRTTTLFCQLPRSGRRPDLRSSDRRVAGRAIPRMGLDGCSHGFCWGGRDRSLVLGLDAEHGRRTGRRDRHRRTGRSEEHTSELQSLMRISYAVFCLKKKNLTITT